MSARQNGQVPDVRTYSDKAGVVGVTAMATLAGGVVVAGVVFNDEPAWTVALLPVLAGWAWLARRRMHIRVSDDEVEVGRYLMSTRTVPLDDIVGLEEEWSWVALRSQPGMRLEDGSFVPLTPAMRFFAQRTFHLEAASDIARRLANRD